MEQSGEGVQVCMSAGQACALMFLSVCMHGVASRLRCACSLLKEVLMNHAALRIPARISAVRPSCSFLPFSFSTRQALPSTENMWQTSPSTRRLLTRQSANQSCIFPVDGCPPRNLRAYLCGRKLSFLEGSIFDPRAVDGRVCATTCSCAEIIAVSGRRSSEENCWVQNQRVVIVDILRGCVARSWSRDSVTGFFSFRHRMHVVCVR